MKPPPIPPKVPPPVIPAVWPNGSGVFAAPDGDRVRRELGRIVDEAGRRRVWRCDAEGHYHDLGLVDDFLAALALLPLPPETVAKPAPAPPAQPRPTAGTKRKTRKP